MPSIATPTFREPWGLVVNEAMNRGLAVIASDAVGAAAGGLVADERQRRRRPGRRRGRPGGGDRPSRGRSAASPADGGQRRGGRPRVHARGVGAGLFGSSGHPRARPGPLIASEESSYENRPPAQTPRALRGCPARDAACRCHAGPGPGRRPQDHPAVRRRQVAGRLPPSAYAKALKEISATTEEYSECGQLIRQAQGAAAAGHGGGGGGGGGLTAPLVATPAEQRAIADAARAGSAPVTLGGEQINPGVVHANVSSAFSTLPTPVLVLLGFLAACAVAFGGRIRPQAVPCVAAPTESAPERAGPGATPAMGVAPPADAGAPSGADTHACGRRAHARPGDVGRNAARRRAAVPARVLHARRAEPRNPDEHRARVDARPPPSWWPPRCSSCAGRRPPTGCGPRCC